MKHDSVIPYKEKESSKKAQVAEMFDNISHRYDFLNHFLSLGIDIYWRKKALKYLKGEKIDTLLDVATGTGDFALEAYHKLKPKKTIGVDISEGMLSYGKEKIKKRNLEEFIHLQVGDSEKLPFENNYFDAVIVSFGVRNFENLEQGLKEIRRVLKANGKLVILEFSKPNIFPFKHLYQFYFRYILPMVGKLVSKDNAAYTYLPESVNAFPDGEEFLKVLQKIELQKAICVPLTLGIASIYISQK